MYSMALPEESSFLRTNSAWPDKQDHDFWQFNSAAC